MDKYFRNIVIAYLDNYSLSPVILNGAQRSESRCIGTLHWPDSSALRLPLRLRSGLRLIQDYGFLRASFLSPQNDKG